MTLATTSMLEGAGVVAAWFLRKIYSRLFREPFRIRGKLERLSSELYSKDVLTSVFEVISIFKDSLEDVGGKRDLASLQKEASEVKNEFTIPSHFYAVLDMADAALRTLLLKEPLNNPRGEAIRLFNMLEHEVSLEIEEAIALASQLVPPEGCIATIGYSTILKEAISRAPRIDLVVVGERYPFLDGRKLARELRTRRRKVIYVPDVNIHSSIVNCNAVFIPFYGIASGKAIMDVGAPLLIHSARDLGKPVIALGTDLMLYTVGIKVDLASAINKYVVDVKALTESVEVEWSPIAMFDTIDLSYLDRIVVSSTILPSGDEAVIAQAAERIVARLEDNIKKGFL